MLIHLLATDLRTPGPTLAWLAGRADLTPQALLALAAHPHLPAGTPLRPPAGANLTGHASDLLTAALTDPRVSAERRAQILAFTPAAAVTHAIDAGAPLTAAELSAHHSAHPPTTTDEHVAYLNHPATPTHLAAPAIAAATPRTRTAAGDPYLELLIEAATVRHATGATTPRALTALAAPDPAATYALLLAAHARAPQNSGGWWAGVVLDAHPHPALIDQFLTIARSGDYRYRIFAQVLYAAANIPTADRLAALVLTEHHYFERRDAARTAPDHAIAAIATYRGARLDALSNPNASAATLTALYHALTQGALEDGGAARRSGAEAPAPLPATTCEALATHPNISAELRGELLTHSHAHSLSRRLHRAGTPAGVLDIPYEVLRPHHAQDHARRWAARAYASYPHADTTLEQAQALLVLDASPFSGTFRELLETAYALRT